MSVQFLKSVGPTRARALARLGVETVADLLQFYPRRYLDRSCTHTVSQVRPGQEVTLTGEVLTAAERRTRRGGTVQTVSIADETGVIFCVWFNMKYVLKQFRSGRRVTVSGTVQSHGRRRQLVHPDFEFAPSADKDGPDEDPRRLHTGTVVPIYNLTAGIGQHWLRALVDQALHLADGHLVETLPQRILRTHDLPDRATALHDIHFPGDQRRLDAARRRLVYEEIFLIQILMALRRDVRARQPGIRLGRPGDLTTRLVGDLPFTLTGAQRRVLQEILQDLRSGRVMHRLLQGDVGSGKTLVALIACLFVIEQGHQAVFMAPTEVLARQHGATIAGLCAPLQVTVETLTGSTPAAQRRAILAGVAAGEIDLLVGTHAVIQEDVHLPRLALAVVDEQHRFGVRQRGRSVSAGDRDGALSAHALVMSATPIPRSLSLTLYGDLDLSFIDELPAGRQPVLTRIVADKQEDEVWQACRRELDAGHQVFVIFPVIEETEGQDLKAATAEFERLDAEIFPDHEVALLHGRLPAKEKDAVMQEFAAGGCQVLVATTVVEVGIDVPNATAMVIHNPERFGLAQLHQLRGRIGRGRAQAHCWLLCDRFLAEESYQRIRFFADHRDGFALAEEDLRLRGPGDIWGVRQHGAPGFRLANPLRDGELVSDCRRRAQDLLSEDPDLSRPENAPLQAAIGQTFGPWLPPLAG